MTELVSRSIPKTVPTTENPKFAEIETATKPAQISKKNFSLWDKLDENVSKHKPKHTSSSRAIVEVQRYLDDDVLTREKNPLQWWKENSYKYPFLGKLVRERCCVLATSVPCERLFSKAGNILNERRTRLSSRKLEQLLFLNTVAQNQ